MKNKCKLPTWAPRVSQREVRLLYETDAKGIYDEDLINEVGYGLLVRCQSFIDANAARAGKARCPSCSAIVMHSCQKDEILRCDCGWELSWGDYFKTIQHVQLSGAEPVLEQFQSFIDTFPAAHTPQKKMMIIDRLLHGFHWYYKTSTPTRPVAINLIEGRLRDVVVFLDQLTYSDQSTPGIAENYIQWDEKINMNRSWYPSRREKNHQT
ncbi:MAG: hypothetical protein P1S60_19340 [Anaerolineae bacterium]|nr:hypothetical protein [Anaerolineae bacterium]